MIQGLQMLCGVVLLAMITAGWGWSAEAIEIRLHRGTPLEARARPTAPLAAHVSHMARTSFTPVGNCPDSRGVSADRVHGCGRSILQNVISSPAHGA
jgi:hypothetical protein